MKASFPNHEITSFVLWLNNRLQNVGQGFLTQSGAMYRQTDTARSGWIYASPYKGWVYDSAVSGAQVPSGVYNSAGQWVTRASGLVFDFNNGRVLSRANLGPVITGAYSPQEYNVYYSTTEEVNFYLEQAFNANPDLPQTATGALPYRFVAPCSIITDAYSHSAAFELGRARMRNEGVYRVFTISTSNFAQAAVNGLLNDAKESSMASVQYSDAPLTFSGDLKGGYYSYADLQATYGCGGIFIKDVFSLRLNDKVNHNSSFFLSVCEFDLEVIRIPTR